MDVAKMQTKLARWSQDQSFNFDDNFDDIFNIVCDADFLYARDAPARGRTCRPTRDPKLRA